MNITVKLRYYPDLQEMSYAVWQVLFATPLPYNRLGPAAQLDLSVPMGTAWHTFKGFGTYKNASTDENRMACLKTEVYREIVALQEELMLASVPEQDEQMPLDVFVETQAQSQTKYLYLGPDLWSEFCTSYPCQRMVTNRVHVPWLYQVVDKMKVLPSIQAGAGFIPPMLKPRQALSLDSDITYAFDCHPVQELSVPDGDPEFLVVYDAGFDWIAGSRAIYNM